MCAGLSGTIMVHSCHPGIIIDGTFFRSQKHPCLEIVSCGASLFIQDLWYDGVWNDATGPACQKCPHLLRFLLAAVSKFR